MLRILLLVFICLCSFQIKASEPKVFLTTTVKDVLWKRNLPEAYILVYDEKGDLSADTLRTMGHRYNIDNSQIYIEINKSDTVCIFDITAPGYETQTITWPVKKMKKRERYQEIPTIFLKKAKQLKELTVTGSKVKFYNKGDTVVYDASAFQMAEGSMLDARCSHIPVAGS